jgi:hypothetical protein
VAFRSLSAPTNKISETKKMLWPAQNLDNDSTNLTLLRLKLKMTFHKIDLKLKILRNKCKENLKGVSFKTKTKRKLFQNKTYYTTKKNTSEDGGLAIEINQKIEING